MKTSKKRVGKPKPPLLEELMIEITPRNRKSLEAKLGIEIPADVQFIVPPDTLETEEFWEWANKKQLDELTKRLEDSERID